MPKNKVLKNKVLQTARNPNFLVAEVDLGKRKSLISSVIKVGTLCLSLHFSSLAAAEQTMSVEAIQQAVSDDYEQEVSHLAHVNGWQDYDLNYEVRVPGSANHLPVCPEPLVITGRDNQSIPVGNLKRAVSCETPEVSWRINTAIKAALNLEVVVANTLIQRDEELSYSALRLERRTLTRPEDFFSSIAQAAGKQASRRIRNGQLINPNSVSAADFVKKGNQVVIIASKDGFTAKTKGVALEDGVKGQQIDIQNSTSGKSIKAVVIGLNQVQTQF
ncbi:flagellar basal body P-ring formation chaperone FlgA [Vibrio sp. B1FLJ16]|uniref:flagellar basal body P-ring formation chaperone FlgA n=1 Tax=Vibrio sp. B1FLJ16 TaxID=2751178 RepID=UPI0015F409A0|nr:flagellar basal body P-ring formation chaperone FlgA [Vibrio sp. B1FLJ16]CAD7822060.1 Involved in the assembly process of the P-ring formation. It may associate with FlgF on the rod constituting a structure essential for the P-ring assembly or may act as a modulator protein for the P-ring assembly [Vibrio sp. B1FLJ16]CAE6947968.1 Involved in the assembly process of the P-ring formation. It may associate with FlgF on the rod constituting a structure essential for the P-ring assembly or may act 